MQNYNDFEGAGHMNYTHNVDVEKKSGCFGNALKVGCGFILGVFFTSILVFFWSAKSTESINDDYSVPSSKKELYDEPERPVQYFHVRSKKAKATIHTGMPKDSVILLLGQPTEFISTSYHDEITYRYGSYDLNCLQIEFRNGMISSVSQH